MGFAGSKTRNTKKPETPVPQVHSWRMNDLFNIVEAVKIKVICDGSYNSRIGVATAVVVFENEDEMCIGKGCVRVPGPDTDIATCL